MDSESLLDEARALTDAAKALRGVGSRTVVRHSPSGPPTAAVSGYDKVLLVEATASARRASDGNSSDDATTEAGATMATILCGAAACEAWLSEYLARWEGQVRPLPPDLEALRDQPNALEQWKALLKSRLPSFDAGARKEFLALGCLFRLRDHVAHRHARMMALDSFPRRLADCVRQRVIPVRQSSRVDWTSIVFVHEVAAWAAETAKSWIALAEQDVPNPGLPAA